MRIYLDCKEMYEEIKRDLSEMGTLVKPKTMQDKNVEGNQEYWTKELQNYSYSLLNPSSLEISKFLPVSKEWADMEFEERVLNPKNNHGKTVNPGEAYKLRKEVWEEFLHNGKFSYTYNARIWKNDQIETIINRIKEDPDSRQLWLSIWDPGIDPNRIGGVGRVPCSLGYNFQVRNGKLNMHYLMRSSDFSTHFSNDVYLAIKLLEWVSEQVKIPVGMFSHTMFSLHVYLKDVEGVF